MILTKLLIFLLNTSTTISLIPHNIISLTSTFPMCPTNIHIHINIDIDITTIIHIGICLWYCSTTNYDSFYHIYHLNILFDIVVCDVDLILLLSILVLLVLAYFEAVLGKILAVLLMGLCWVSGWALAELAELVNACLVIGFFVVFILMLCFICGLLVSLWLVVFICRICYFCIAIAIV